MQLRSVYMGMAMMGFMHGYMKFTQPLFVQAVMATKNLYDATPFKIHVLGQKAEGDLKRPWKAGGGMFGGALFWLIWLPKDTYSHTSCWRTSDRQRCHHRGREACWRNLVFQGRVNLEAYLST